MPMVRHPNGHAHRTRLVTRPIDRIERDLVFAPVTVAALARGNEFNLEREVDLLVRVAGDINAAFVEFVVLIVRVYPER